MEGYETYSGIINISGSQLKCRQEETGDTKIYIDYNRIPLEENGYDISESDISDYVSTLYTIHGRVYKIEILSERVAADERFKPIAVQIIPPNNVSHADRTVHPKRYFSK